MYHSNCTGTLIYYVCCSSYFPFISPSKAGAVGFLWMRRSIAYQHALFEAITTGIEPKQAAYDAYRSTLMPFHGWAMRRLYTAFLGQCTPNTTKGWCRIRNALILRSWYVAVVLILIFILVSSFLCNLPPLLIIQ